MTRYTTEITSDQLVSDNPIHQRLLKAYYVAKEHIQGDLLELGCGEGRGIEIIKPLCNRYVALDKIAEVINELKEKYPDVVFRQSIFPPLFDLSYDCFDTIVSFQVIEHIENDGLFLKEIFRVLKPGGKALITTPNRPKSITRNPWHIREYTENELYKLAKSIFPKVEMVGISGNQKVMTYYEQNKKSAERIMRWDILDLQHRLPASVLKIPYDLLNRFNRNKLGNHNSNLVKNITHQDYLVTSQVKDSLDLFCMLQK